MDERIVAAVRTEGLGRKIKDVLIACYDRIIAREIVSVAELLVYIEDLGWDPRLERVVRRCYQLIREIHWGIFRNLDATTHPELWSALTITNRTMPDIADIKRNVIVPNVYCGLLDIHGYTEFCRKNRHNVSVLRVLDDVIQHDIRSIADKNGCLAARSAGDNIILIGSSPTDTIRACLGIIDGFSRKRVIRTDAIAESRRGKSVSMQDFQVSAGIAGGLHYNSLIVTQDGDISGSVINTAARLQGFAGTITPDRSKVMIASPVYAGHMKEIESGKRSPDGHIFFDCGRVGFKGVAIGVYELLYAEREIKKVRYQPQYTELLEMTAKSVWNHQLVPQVTKLVAKVLETNPISRVQLSAEGTARTFSSAQVIKLCDEAVALYESDHDHRQVTLRLQQIATVLGESANFDPLVLIHFRRIVNAYDQMVREFVAIQYEKIIENQIGLFSAKERSVMEHAARLERIRDTLIERGKRDNNIYSSTMLWNKIVSEFEGGWDFDVYSGKR